MAGEINVSIFWNEMGGQPIACRFIRELVAGLPVLDGGRDGDAWATVAGEHRAEVEARVEEFNQAFGPGTMNPYGLRAVWAERGALAAS